MLYRWEHDGVVVYRSPVLDALDVPHGFGTRRGDDKTIATALGLGGRAWVTVHQVHGHAVHYEDREPFRDQQPRCDADAVVLKRKDAVTRILTADCVPLLLASSDGSAVAAVHAGWRGFLAGVIGDAVDTLASAGFVAAIGPCIGVKRFEVGEEVAEQFDPRFVRRDLGSRPHIDLRAASFAMLQRLGAQQIDTTDRCTAEHEKEFFSYRRDVTQRQLESTGRMTSVIGCALYN
ncbi:MAG: polyphenol oxidase family protein [Planctomycetota bacterium]